MPAKPIVRPAFSGDWRAGTVPRCWHFWNLYSRDIRPAAPYRPPERLEPRPCIRPGASARPRSRPTSHAPACTRSLAAPRSRSRRTFRAVRRTVHRGASGRVHSTIPFALRRRTRIEWWSLVVIRSRARPTAAVTGRMGRCKGRCLEADHYPSASWRWMSVGYCMRAAVRPERITRQLSPIERDEMPLESTDVRWGPASGAVAGRSKRRDWDASGNDRDTNNKNPLRKSSEGDSVQVLAASYSPMPLPA